MKRMFLISLISLLLTAFTIISVRLNVSDIKCDDEKVKVHFVLIDYGQSDQGDILTYVSNGITRTAEWDKYVGNVNHFNNVITMPNSGIFTVTSVSFISATYTESNLPFVSSNLNCTPTAVTLKTFNASSSNNDVLFVFLAVFLFIMVYNLYKRKN